MPKTARKKQMTDKRGKIVVSVMIRTPENRFVKGNKIKVFSLKDQKVTTVAAALAPAVAKLRGNGKPQKKKEQKQKSPLTEN